MLVGPDSIARPIGRLAALFPDFDRARPSRIAHEIHAQLQAPFFIALGQLDHADLRLTRRADGGRVRATSAAANAAAYGCAGLTKRASAILDDF